MQVDWTAAVLSVGVGLGLASAAGLRVFLPLLLLGSAASLGWVPLTDGFAWLATGPALAALAVASVLEIGAYYVPWVDNLLDLLAAPLAIAAGITATAAVTTELPPALRWALAIVAGGGTAGIVQGLTSVARLKSTATTGGAGNAILATLELVGSLVTAIVAITLPLLAILLVVGIVLLVRRVARRLFRRSIAATMTPTDPWSSRSSG
jgi:hypothetical protein